MDQTQTQQTTEAQQTTETPQGQTTQNSNFIAVIVMTWLATMNF